MFKCFTFPEELDKRKKLNGMCFKLSSLTPVEESNLISYCSYDHYLEFLTSWLPHMDFLIFFFIPHYNTFDS